jgi:hypothetical protein
LLLIGKRREATKSGTITQKIVMTTIPNHPGDMPEGTLRAILREAGITPNDFLKKKQKVTFGES